MQERPPWYAKLLPNYKELVPNELAPGTISGNTFDALAVDPDIILPWLLQHLKTQYRVVFIQQSVSSLEEARQLLNCRTLVNASGHGASMLARDPDTIPVRGQTMLVQLNRMSSIASVAHEIRIRRGNEYTYIIPRLA